MLQLIAVIQKELLLLIRDKAGLLVLFVMPAVLETVITLVQENALKSMGESDTRILLIDGDRQMLGRQIVDALKTAQGLIVTQTRILGQTMPPIFTITLNKKKGNPDEKPQQTLPLSTADPGPDCHVGDVNRMCRTAIQEHHRGVRHNGTAGI